MNPPTQCEWLGIDKLDRTIEATSCGLDLWNSEPALSWIGTYLRATPEILRVSSNDSHASIVCQLRKLPGGVSLATAYPYGRIAGNVALFWRSVSIISKALRSKKIVRLEIPFTGSYSHQLELAPPSSLVRVPESMDEIRHVLDITATSHTEFEQMLDPNIRWAVRKAKRNGCSVRVAGADEIDILQDLYSRTMRAKGAPVNYGPERWSGIASQLMPKNRGCLYIGELHGKPCGMAAAVDGEISRHLIQLAVPPDSQSSRLGELLVMTTMHDARTKGLRYYDFMASPASDKGLIAFKSKWGTSAEPIRHAVIPGIPGLHYIVDAARLANRMRARFRAP